MSRVKQKEWRSPVRRDEHGRIVGFEEKCPNPLSKGVHHVRRRGGKISCALCGLQAPYSSEDEVAVPQTPLPEDELEALKKVVVSQTATLALLIGQLVDRGVLEPEEGLVLAAANRGASSRFPLANPADVWGWLEERMHDLAAAR